MRGQLRLLWCLMAGLCFSASIQGQDLSNKGKEFWLSFPAHVDATQAVLGIYITSDKPASGTVTFNGGSLPWTIGANGVARLFIGPGGNAPNTAVYQGQLEGILANSGIKVNASQPVVVYAHVIRSARSGSTLALPVTVWGKDYIIPSYRSAGMSGANSGFPVINVMAKDPDTQIEITPRVASRDGSRPAGVPYTITLSKPGDVYQVQYQQNSDISGTVVRSVPTPTGGCKPIGVFSATTWSAFDCAGASGGDNLLQQVFPNRSFGKRYLLAPFKFKQRDIVRVYVLNNATKVTRTENGTATVLAGLQPGGFYEFYATQPILLEADDPISVVQYMTSQSCDQPQSDPEMVILTPVEQSINNITVFNAHRNWVPPNQSNVNRCFYNIIIKTVAAPSFRINGQPVVTPFAVIPGTEYSFVQEEVTTAVVNDPVQTLNADSGFSAIAYGYGNVESYGYNAGTNVRDLFQFVTISNTNGAVNFPTTCTNTPFNFTITLPYPTKKLEWKFNGLFPDETVNNPTPDSTYFLEGTKLHVYRLTKIFTTPTKGIYPIQVITENPTSDGCTGEQQIDYDLTVVEQPSADFDFSFTGCVGDTIQFSDKSKTDGVRVIRYTWKFGDNTTDSIRNPKKAYTGPNTYNVEFNILTEVGCSNKLVKPIVVSPPPVASFSISQPACEKGNIVLTDKSTTTTIPITNWVWRYPTGARDSLTTNASRTLKFDTLGNYPVSLIVGTAGGCRSKAFVDTIRVGALPLVDFQLPAGICLPNGTASFTNLSKLPVGDTAKLSYFWTFGDGGTSTAINPTHSYKTAGPFTVTLKVTSSRGCETTLSKTLSTVYDQPKAGMTIPTAACAGDSVRLTDNSSYGANQVAARQIWQIGTNKPDTVNNPLRLFNTAGNFTVRHWVASDKGCISDTVTQNIKINARPVAAFDVVAAACANKLTIFQDKTTVADGTVTNRTWLMGDGTTIVRTNNAPFGHVYAANGTFTYTVRLIAQSSLGCISDTLVKTVLVSDNPKNGFVLPEVCLNDAFALFTNTTTFSGSGPLTYAWNFGDPNANPGNPNTSTDRDGRHRYSQTGNYTVQLITTTAAGCADTLVKTLVVNGDKPKADFTVLNASRLCGDLPVQIENNSTVNFGAVTRLVVYWNWPNATDTTIDENPAAGKRYQKQYAAFQSPASKTAQVRMVAFSGGVCSGELIQTITLQATPSIQFNAIAGICADATPRLLTEARDISVLNAPGVYSGTGVSNGSFNPSGLTPGTSYVIRYIATSSFGCADTATSPITVFQLPQAIIQVPGPNCAGKDLILSDASTTPVGRVVQWSWDFGDGNTATRATGGNFTYRYPNTTTYNLRLIVRTDSGCASAPATVPLVVNHNPVAAFNLPTVCLPEGRAAFTAATTIGDGTQAQLAHRWNFGDGNTATGNTTVHNYRATGPFTVTLVATSNRGCIDTLRQQLTTIYAQALANFTVLPDSVCLGTPITFTDISNAAGRRKTSYTWSMGDGQQRSDSTFSYTYRAAGRYNVAMFYRTDVGCFSDTVVKSVVINTIPVVNAGPDKVVLEGGQVTLPATVSNATNPQYRWTPAQWLSDPTALQPISSPQGDIVYRLTVVSQGNCVAFDDVAVTLLLKPEIPSAFSPNGDGINDVWNIRYLDSYPGATVQVFDRYGKQVFSSTGYNTPWGGTLSGQPMPAGVYYYVVNPRNGRNPYTGSVTILR